MEWQNDGRNATLWIERDKIGGWFTIPNIHKFKSWKNLWNIRCLKKINRKIDG